MAREGSYLRGSKCWAVLSIYEYTSTAGTVYCFLGWLFASCAAHFGRSIETTGKLEIVRNQVAELQIQLQNAQRKISGYRQTAIRQWLLLVIL